jgi:hypothetical protein
MGVSVLPSLPEDVSMKKALGLWLLGVPVGLIVVILLFTKAC